MFLYALATSLYFLIIKAAAIVHPKAKMWVNGRKKWRKTLPDYSGKTNRPVWMHCASHGEFEQGRPVLELIRHDYPEVPIVVSFFSPSGFHQSKVGELADAVVYLPADTPHNARAFIEQLNPRIALFVKYDLWYFFIRACHRRNIPLVLVAGLFRSGQIYFKPWARFMKRMLSWFDMILVQNKASAELLFQAGLQQATITGDPRVDRVVGLAGQSEEFPEISKFCGTSQVLVCGSTHREDEQMLAATIQSLPDRDQWKILIAPHEIHEQAISRLINDLPLDSVRYSELPNKPSAHILIIDCIGLLSRLYKYGRVAYIGGGFGKGIHNTLEPFSFGLPVIIGPRFRAFDEAVAMVDAGGARVVKTASDIQEVLKDWSDNDTLEKASQAVLSFIEANRGAARHTMNQISQLLS